MIIEIEIPDTLPHGHCSSFSKGISEVLLKTAESSLDQTPHGHERSRKLGEELGEKLYKIIKNIEK